jgi:hypothetical protein
MQHMANSMIGGVSDNNVWYVNFRASNHMTSHGKWFKDTKDLKTPRFVEISGDDTTHPITQISKVPLSMQDGQTKYLKYVLHVPTITKNLVSVSQMVEQGLQVTFNPNGCFVKDMNQGKLIAKGERNGQMFTLDVNMPKVNFMLFTHGKRTGNIRIWHKRVDHVNLQRLKLMEKQNLVGNLPKFGTKEVMLKVCEACQLGKQARHPFLAQTTHVSCKPLEMIHLDVWTTKTESIGRCKYYVNFIDDHTRKVWVYFMKHKGEVFQHFLNFKAMLEKEKDVNFKCLRSDGGGEYFSNEFSEYLKEHGIQRKYSLVIPHSRMELLKGKIGKL